jgi:type IV pilus assembly protein PilF
MFKISHIMTLVILVMNLTACQSTQPPTEDEVKKTSAAKINDQLGIVYLERHDMQRAKQKFLLALDQAPNIPEPWYSMAYYLESTGNREQAKKYYLKAVEIAPERGDVLNNYGTFLCRSGDYRGAVNHFLKAAQDTKYLDVSAAYENAGLCSLKIPNHVEAVKYFEKALAEDPNRPVSLLELAELNYTQGNYSKSRKQLDQFLKQSQPSMQSYLLEQKLDTKLNT